MHRVTQAEAYSDFTVDLRFEDGRRAKISLAELVVSAPIAAPFQEPAKFAQALRIAEDGDVLRWSEQFELHADSLRYRAFPDEFERDYGMQRRGRGRPRGVI